MKNACTYIIIIVLIFCSSTVFCQTDTTGNTIDKQLNACLDSSQNNTTAGMIGCNISARDAWDKELNKYYDLLMQTLSKDEKDKLKAAQRKWLSFRDSENNFSATMYRNMQGTMWGIAKVQSNLNIVKQRTLELKAYYTDKAPR